MTDDFDPPPGIAINIAPDIRRILAPNPSPMTCRGTNTYLLGTEEIAVIDPGPDHRGHLAAILAALKPQQRITHIFVTHSHLDHSPLARPLAAATGAPVYGFGEAHAGRSAIMRALAKDGLTGGGEGVDTRFAPDLRVADGEVISGAGWTLQVMHTPGHLGNHICLASGTRCFSGDHVMGWASSLVSPPDGDLTDFMASCEKLRQRQWSQFLPGHGPVVTAPRERLDWLIAHRKARETAILSALRQGPAAPAEITRRVYSDIQPALLPAAQRNVLAHLIDLLGKSLVRPLGKLTAEAVFKATGSQPG